MLTNVDRFLLCSFEDNPDFGDEYVSLKLLWKGEWNTVFAQNFPNNVNSREALISNASKIHSKEDEFYKIFSCGISALSAFCEANWTGPSVEKAKEIASIKLDFFDSYKTADSSEEIYTTILYFPLLQCAIDIIDNLCLENEMIILWWKLRAYNILQRILDENSPRVFSIVEKTLQLLSNMESNLKTYPDLQALLNIEMSQAYLLYGRVQNSETCLQKASTISGLTLSLKGALGKRTKFQQVALSQLCLDVKFSDSVDRTPSDVTHGSTALLKCLSLNDDLRLENIEFTDNKDSSSSTLTSLEQQLCLATVQHIQRSQPKDELAQEELMPYLDLLLVQNYGPWSVRSAVFYMKCRIESSNKRTVERSMMQCEQYVNNFSAQNPSVCSRLSYLWSSGLPSITNWKSLLGDLLLSLGLVKAALDIFLEIQLWEEVIACYTILQLRHKAAEVIEQQIALQPTAKLYCLLGDAKDDPSYYQTAWDFSNHKSSKAQRHWGNYLFSHKKYEECIPHYLKSCEINSLQESVWLRLGYAALTTEQWEIAANAYRRYTYLEPHSFEAWNNLAKVYVKQGNKERAYKALNETIKYNYDNWQVWENLLIVSLDTGHFDDVIQSYNRILDLKKKHWDEEVLTLLVKAILEKKEDADGNSVTRLSQKALELFARLTCTHPTEPTVWQLYADLTPNILSKGQRLLKVFSSITSQNTSWVNDETLTDKIITIVESLALCALQCVKEIDNLDCNQVWQLVSSSRLSTQAVVRAVINQRYEQFDDKIKTLQELLEKLTMELQKR